MLESMLRRLIFAKTAMGGALVEATATGNPLTFLTDKAKPLKSLLIPFTPVQSGTGDPSPSNIRPVSPWEGASLWHGGKNLLKMSSETMMYKSTTNISFEYTETGAIINIKQTGETYGFALFKILPITASLVGVKFVHHSDDTYTSDALISCDENGENRTSVSSNNGIIKESDVGKYLAFRAYATEKAHGEERVITDAQVEVGPAPTAYVPYSPITETDISFPSPVYGGTLDVVSGVMTVTHIGLVTTWGAGASATELPDYGQTRKTFNPYAPVKTGSARNICNIAKYTSSEENSDPHYYIGGSGAYRLFLPTETPDSAEIVIVSELATPQEIQLDPVTVNALVGNNTIWSDTNGENTVVYLKKHKKG